MKSTKSLLGTVIEFRFVDYYAYGVVIEEGDPLGDVLLMLAPKFPEPLKNLDGLLTCPVRCKFKFIARQARSWRHAAYMGIVGHLDVSLLPNVDPRFRMTAPGISTNGRWRIIDGKRFAAVEELTPELALLSDDFLPNVPFIKHYYDLDIYPWSASQTSSGKTSFDCDAFEQKMRKNLGRPAKVSVIASLWRNFRKATL